MSKLTRCVYGFETDPKKTPFGFLNNQFRIDAVVQNAGWFNLHGERLGSGDLSMKDLETIGKSISKDDAFLVLSDANSGWDLPSDLDRSAPGMTYVMQRVAWLVVKDGTKGNCVFRVHDDYEKVESSTKDGIAFKRLPRKNMYEAFGMDSKGRMQPKQIAAPPTTLKEVKEDVLAQLLKSGLKTVATKPGSKSVIGAAVRTATPSPVKVAKPLPAPGPVKTKTTTPTMPTLTLPPKKTTIRIMPPGPLPPTKRVNP